MFLAINCSVGLVRYNKYNPMSFFYKIKKISELDLNKVSIKYLVLTILMSIFLSGLSLIFSFIIGFIQIKSNINFSLFLQITIYLSIYFITCYKSSSYPGELIDTEISYWNPKSISLGFKAMLNKSKIFAYSYMLFTGFMITLAMRCWMDLYFERQQLIDKINKKNELIQPLTEEQKQEIEKIYYNNKEIAKKKFFQSKFSFDLYKQVKVASDLLKESDYTKIFQAYESIDDKQSSYDFLLNWSIAFLQGIIFTYLFSYRVYSNDPNKKYLYGEEFLEKIKKR